MTRTRFRRSRTDYPEGVLAVYDNGGKTYDRYTVVYTPETVKGADYFPITSMSRDPFWPQGVCMHDSLPWRPVGSGWGVDNSIGKVIAFEALPEDCQRVVRQDLSEPLCTCLGPSATTTEEDCPYHTDPDIEPEEGDRRRG